PARLLELHRVVVHSPAQVVELGLLVDHVEAEEDGELDESGQEDGFSAGGDMVAEEAGANQPDVERWDRARERDDDEKGKTEQPPRLPLIRGVGRGNCPR